MIPEKRTYWRLFWSGIFITALFNLSFASEADNSSVKVIRSDNKPLPDAIVKIAPLEELNRKTKTITGLTDQSGSFSFPFSESVIIQISHLGFSTITDTLLKPDHKTYSISSSSQNIQDVVVTGQYAATTVQKSVYEVKVINGEVIRAKGANNLREALQTELGIDLGQDQIFGSNMALNGISGEGVKIMVDGVPIVGRLDGKLDLSQIAINNIERIEVVEGPLSVMYGTDAMGGVVNIITKSFQAEKVNLNLKGYYETVGQYNVELNTGFSFKKNQIYMSGGRNFFSGFTTLNSVERFQEWKPKEQYFADAKYIFNGNRFRISLSGSFFRELMLDRSAPKRTLNFDNGDTTWTYKGDDVHYLTYRPRAGASLMYRFKENSQVDLLLAYSGFFRFANAYSKNLVTGNEQLSTDKSAHDTARYHQIVARATYSLPAWKNRLNFFFGVDLNQEYIRQSRIPDETKKRGDYAAFGSARITLVEGLDIQPAVRFAYNTLYKAPLVPSLNLKYGWKDKMVFRASYGRGYRAPSIKELFLDFNIDAHIIKGNDTLKAEDGHNAAGSFSYLFSFRKTHSLNFSTSGFFNYILNKIDLVRVENNNGSFTPVYQYANFKNYQTYGAEAGVTYKWTSLQLGAFLQYTDYKVIYKSSGDETINMWSPEMTAMAGYLIPKAEIAVSVRYKYNGIKPLFNINNQFEAGTRSAYHMIDVSMSRSFWKDRIQLTIGGKNLAGVKNVATQGVEIVGHNSNPNQVNIGWGRTFFTSLVLHFSK